MPKRRRKSPTPQKLPARQQGHEQQSDLSFDPGQLMDLPGERGRHTPESAGAFGELHGNMAALEALGMGGGLMEQEGLLDAETSDLDLQGFLGPGLEGPGLEGPEAGSPQADGSVQAPTGPAGDAQAGAAAPSGVGEEEQATTESAEDGGGMTTAEPADAPADAPAGGGGAGAPQVPSGGGGGETVAGGGGGRSRDAGGQAPTPPVQAPTSMPAPAGGGSQRSRPPVIDKIAAEVTGSTPAEQLSANMSLVDGFAGQLTAALSALQGRSEGIVGQVDGWVANATGRLDPGDYASQVQPAFSQARASVQGELADAPGRIEGARQVGMGAVDTAETELCSRIDGMATQAMSALDGIEAQESASIQSRFSQVARSVVTQGTRCSTAAVRDASAEAGRYRQKAEKAEGEEAKTARSKAEAAGKVGTRVAQRCQDYAGKAAASLEQRGKLAAAAVKGEVDRARAQVRTSKQALQSAVKTAASTARSTLETDAGALSDSIDASRTAYVAQLDADERELGDDVGAEVQARQTAIEKLGSDAKTSVPASVEGLRTGFEAQLDGLRSTVGSVGEDADAAEVQSLVDSLSGEWDKAHGELDTSLSTKGDELQSSMELEVTGLGGRVSELVTAAQGSAGATAQEFSFTAGQQVVDFETSTATAGDELTTGFDADKATELDALEGLPLKTGQTVQAARGKADGFLETVMTGITARLDGWVNAVPGVIRGAALAAGGDLDDAGWDAVVDQQMALQQQVQRMDPRLVKTRVEHLARGYDMLRSLRELNAVQLEAVRQQFESTTGKDFDEFVATKGGLNSEQRNALQAYARGDKLQGALAELRDHTAAGGLWIKEDRVADVLSSLSSAELSQLRQLAANDPEAKAILEESPELFDSAQEDAAAAEGAVKDVEQGTWARLGVDPNDLTSLGRVPPEVLASEVADGNLPREQLLLVMKQNGISPDNYDGFEIVSDPQRAEKVAANNAKVYAEFIKTDLYGAMADAGWGGEDTSQNRKEMRGLLNEIQEATASGTLDPARLDQFKARYNLLNHVHQRAFNSRMDNVDTAITAAEVTKEVAKTAAVAVATAAGGPAGGAAMSGALEAADSLANDMILEEKDFSDSIGKAALKGGIGLATGYLGGKAGAAAAGYVAGKGASEATKEGVEFVVEKATDYVVGTAAKTIEEVHEKANADEFYKPGDPKPMTITQIATKSAVTQLVDSATGVIADKAGSDRDGAAGFLMDNAKDIVFDTMKAPLEEAVEKTTEAVLTGDSENDDIFENLADAGTDQLDKMASGETVKDMVTTVATNATTEGMNKASAVVKEREPGRAVRDGVVSKDGTEYQVVEVRDDGTATVVSADGEVRNINVRDGTKEYDPYVDSLDPTPGQAVREGVVSHDGTDFNVVEVRDDGTATVMDADGNIRNIRVAEGTAEYDPDTDPALAGQAPSGAFSPSGTQVLPENDTSRPGDLIEPDEPTRIMSTEELEVDRRSTIPVGERDPLVSESGPGGTQILPAMDDPGATQILSAQQLEAAWNEADDVTVVDSGGGTRVDLAAVHDDGVVVDPGAGPEGSTRSFVSAPADTTAGAAPSAGTQPRSGPVAPEHGSSILDESGRHALSDTEDHQLVFRGLGGIARRPGFEHVSRAMFKAGLSEAEAEVVLRRLVSQHGADEVARQHVSAGEGEALEYEHGGRSRHMKANSPVISTSEDARNARSYAPCVFVYDVPKDRLRTAQDGFEEAFMGPSLQPYVIGTLGPGGVLLPLNEDGTPHPDTDLSQRSNLD